MKRQLHVAVIGGGPAGLMAAERISASAIQVTVFDAMPSVGRKFLLAGRGGLNLTHNESYSAFVTRYRERQPELTTLLDAFGPQALQNWTHELGIDTFVGSSGRVFPKEMKAAPLLRAWLKRLRDGGVGFEMRHRWIGWSRRESAIDLNFMTPGGGASVQVDAVVLALGGGSWTKLGSDGAWVTLLEQQGIDVAPLRPANCGFDIGWSAHFQQQAAGKPLKPVALSFVDANGVQHQRRGECMLTATGIEGGLIYAFSAELREMIAKHGSAAILLDLAPDRSIERLATDIGHPRGARSMASHLHSRAGIFGTKAVLLREAVPREIYADSHRLAAAIKAVPLKLLATRPLDEAISSAGGVRLEALDAGLMIRDLPGVFCAGEMLDWEAPTGGYLLTACFSSGYHAGNAVVKWLA